MTECWRQASGAVELYFYGELAAAERDDTEQHLVECPDCRRTLDELKVIRAALGMRPDVAAPANGDWSRFMARLEDAIQQSPIAAIASRDVAPARVRRPFRTVLSIAALLALVTIGVLVALRERTTSSPGDLPSVQPVRSEPVAGVPADSPASADAKDRGAALTQLSEQHFERSKLVVLGLATKDPQDSSGMDWDYERELAASLLSDTRLYRQAADERGMKSLADVMRDLELVLLQTSMSATPDAESLARLQRLIRRRDLITKMEVVKTSGLVP